MRLKDLSETFRDELRDPEFAPDTFRRRWKRMTFLLFLWHLGMSCKQMAEVHAVTHRMTYLW